MYSIIVTLGLQLSPQVTGGLRPPWHLGPLSHRTETSSVGQEPYRGYHYSMECLRVRHRCHPPGAVSAVSAHPCGVRGVRLDGSGGVEQSAAGRVLDGSVEYPNGLAECRHDLSGQPMPAAPDRPPGSTTPIGRAMKAVTGSPRRVVGLDRMGFRSHTRGVCSVSTATARRIALGCQSLRIQVPSQKVLRSLGNVGINGSPMDRRVWV